MIRLLYSVGLLCLALSGWLYYDSLPPPLCIIHEPEREHLELTPQQEQEIHFTLTNPTNEMVKIVGLADC